MGARVLLLDLKDDPAAIAAYDAWHAAGAVPGPVVAGIRASGIVAMEIHRAGNRLVMVMETAPGFDPAARAAADAADPDIGAWEALMDGFQQPIPGTPAGAKWVEAARIFSLAEQPQAPA
jgi:L-rhamnose mutarotase